MSHQASVIDPALFNRLRACRPATPTAVAGELLKSNQIAPLDTQIAIVRARRALDLPLHSIATDSGIHPGTESVEQVLAELRRAGEVPSGIVRHARLVMGFGNIAAHGTDADDDVEYRPALSDAEMALCAESTTLVINWYRSAIAPRIADDVRYVGTTHSRCSPYYGMTSSEPIAAADSFTLAITTLPCLGPGQVVSGFALSSSHAYATAGSYVRRTIEFDAARHAGEELCVVLAGSTNGSGATVLRLEDVSVTAWVGEARPVRSEGVGAGSTSLRLRGGRLRLARRIRASRASGPHRATAFSVRRRSDGRRQVRSARRRSWPHAGGRAFDQRAWRRGPIGPGPRLQWLLGWSLP